MGDASLYDDDIVTWSEQQAAALRALSTRPDLSSSVDWANLIEEVESVGRSQLAGVERKLVLILAHLVKAISVPDFPATRGWRAEITSHQRVVRKQFSAAMRRKIDIDDVWRDAVKDAGAGLLEWGDEPARGLPDRSPLSMDALTATEFDVNEALDAVSRTISRSRP